MTCRSIALLTAVAACGETSVAPELRECAQTYEFGNYGCVQIIGRMVGRADGPLGGFDYQVDVRDSRSPGMLLSGAYQFPERDGSFALRLIQYSPSPISSPDTATVWVRGWAIRPTGGLAAAESLAVVVTVTPVGRIPPPVAVTLRLPIP